MAGGLGGGPEWRGKDNAGAESSCLASNFLPFGVWKTPPGVNITAIVRQFA
jgi:hypothetical protein